MPNSWPYLEPKADGGHGIEDSCPGGGAGRRETPTSQTRTPCASHPVPQGRMSWECSVSLLLLHPPPTMMPLHGTRFSWDLIPPEDQGFSLRQKQPNLSIQSKSISKK